MFAQRSPIALALLGAAVVLAVAFGYEQAHWAIETRGKGLDFLPLRHAASALANGTSVYADRRFVYPPSAAVALLPLTLGSFTGTLEVWIALEVAAVAVAVAVALLPWRSAGWALVAALAAAAVLRSDALRDSLWLGNVTLLLAPLAAAVLVLFERERWSGGSVLLVLSLLLKPLLIPLLAVPLLRGRWRELLGPLLGGAALLAIAVALVPGGSHFFAVLRYLEGGSSLTGRSAVYNISIAGLSSRLGLGVWGEAARALAGAVVIAVAIAWGRRAPAPGGAAAIGTLLLLGLLLAGSLSEVHYLLVAVPCLLVALGASGSRRGWLLAIPGLLAVIAPRSLLGDVAASPADLQVRYLAAEVALAVAAAAVALLRSGWVGRAGRAPARRPGGEAERTLTHP